MKNQQSYNLVYHPKFKVWWDNFKKSLHIRTDTRHMITMDGYYQAWLDGYETQREQQRGKKR